MDIKQLSCKKFSSVIVAGSSGTSSAVILTWKVPPKNCSINELKEKDKYNDTVYIVYVRADMLDLVVLSV